MSAVVATGPGVSGAPVRRRVTTRRARFVMALAAVAGVTFVVLAVLLRAAKGTPFDVAITHWVQRIDTPLFAELMVAISAPGYAPWSWLVVGLAAGGLVLRGFWREALFVLATEGVSWIVASIKLIVERPRPTADLVRVLSEVRDFSYPSGHVVGYVSLYGFLFFLVYVLFKRSWLRTSTLIGLGLMVGLIGISRIYLGHHWASDVLGGYALGTLYLLLLIEAYRFLIIRPAMKPSVSVGTSADDIHGSTVAR
jgi:membrane-associated phospholipid phosphatase